MKLPYIALVGVAASLALTGCGDKEPKGQVVATVDGDEITAIELKNELGNFQTTDAKIRKAAEQQALQGIVARKVLAKAAEKAKIDKSPEYAQQKARAEELLLVQTWQGKLASMVPAPGADEVQKFIGEHPELYAQRTVYVTDQIRMPRGLPPAVIQALSPLNTLEEIAAVLQANKIPFQRGRGQLDALALGPQMAAEINKLAPSAVFVVPAGNLLVANVTVNKVVAPLPAQQATQHATQFLKAQRTQDTVRRQVGAEMAAAKEKVKYAKGYEPATPPAKGAAPPAKAPAAAAPAKPG